MEITPSTSSFEKSFHLSLSNESKIFTNNKIYSFRTQLATPLYLQPKIWEVALTQLFYPKGRYIRIYADSLIELRIAKLKPDESFDLINWTITIPNGKFRSSEEIANNISVNVEHAIKHWYENDAEKIRKAKTQDVIAYITWQVLPSSMYKNAPYKLHKFDYNGELFLIDDTFTTWNPPIRTFITIKSGLEMWRHLGFYNLELNVRQELPLTANKTATDMETRSAGFCIKAPGLIEEQEYRGFLSPVLEIAPYIERFTNLGGIAKETGDQICMHWDYPLYKNVIGGYINQIYIELIDTSDELPIHFSGGKLQFTLNFRQRNTDFL